MTAPQLAYDDDGFPLLTWFGEPWGSPVNEDARRVDVPVGTPCCGCKVAIEPTARGLIIPFLAERALPEAYHLACFRRYVFPGPEDAP